MFSDPDRFAKAEPLPFFSCLDCFRIRCRQILGRCADKTAIGEICHGDSARQSSEYGINEITLGPAALVNLWTNTQTIVRQRTC